MRMQDYSLAGKFSHEMYSIKNALSGVRPLLKALAPRYSSKSSISASQTRSACTHSPPTAHEPGSEGIKVTIT